MNQGQIRRMLRRQCGVVSRRQVLAAGGDDTIIARRVRRREWARVHEGVYVEHTGPLTRRQREWAAVLLHEPAALGGRDALRAHGVIDREAGRHDSIELVVDRSRRVTDPPGITTKQVRRFDDVVLTAAAPPRLRLEHAVLRVASDTTREDAAVGILADAIRDGHTTTDRLGATLRQLTRLPQRALLREVLTDVVAGAQSPLEWRYLRDVERAHGLPCGERQVRETTRVVDGEMLTIVRRDVRYPAQTTLVELDGHLGHALALDRWADLDRDLAAALHGSTTLRAGWAQVLEPCRLAIVVGAVLCARGWAGEPVPCRPGCVVRPARIA